MIFVGHSRTSLLQLRSFRYLPKHSRQPQRSPLSGVRPTTRLDLFKLPSTSQTMSTAATPAEEVGKDTSMQLDTPTSTTVPAQASEQEKEVTQSVDQGELPSLPSLGRL